MEANEKLPVLLIVLAIVFLTSFVVLIRICMSRRIAKKKAQLASRQSQVTSASTTRNNQVRSISATTDWAQTDHQIIFERIRPQHLQNVSRLSPTTPATQIVQEMAEQFRYDSMRMEYERRAQERRDISNRLNNFVHMPPRLDTNNDVTGGVAHEQLTDFSLNSGGIESRETTFTVSNSTPAPRYMFEDDELPSYEIAVATANINR